MSSQVDTVSHRIFKAALAANPDRANLSAIARALGIPTARFWFYVSGDTRMPADQFIMALAAVGALRVDRKGFRVNVPLDAEAMRALREAARSDIVVLRSSKLIGEVGADGQQDPA